MCIIMSNQSDNLFAPTPTPHCNPPLPYKYRIQVGPRLVGKKIGQCKEDAAMCFLLHFDGNEKLHVNVVHFVSSNANCT